MLAITLYVLSRFYKTAIQKTVVTKNKIKKWYKRKIKRQATVRDIIEIQRKNANNDQLTKWEKVVLDRYQKEVEKVIKKITTKQN